MSNLRERVARAMNAVCFDGCEDGEDGFRACVDPPCPCRQAADAAIALVLEEAAKVAADYDGIGMDGGDDCHLGDAFRTRSDIAAAIRALKEKADE